MRTHITLVKVTAKRQVTFPARVLDLLGVKPGDRLELREGPEGFVLRPRRPFCIRIPALALLGVLLLPGLSDAVTSPDDLKRLAPAVDRTVSAGDAEALARLIQEEGIGVDELFPWPGKGCDAPMLVMAVAYGKLPLAAFLIEQGADVGRLATTVASSDGTPARVEAYTPLMIAARVGFLEGAKLLLGKGADVDAHGDAGITALIVAAAFDSAEAIQLLAGAGADLESAADRLGELSSFPELHRVDVPVPRNLVSSGPGFTRIASNSPSNPREVRRLPAGRGATALWVAAATGAEAALRALLAAGADREATASCEGVGAAKPGERECSAARIAQLLGRSGVSRLLGEGAGEAAEAVTVRPTDLRSVSPKELLEKLREIMVRKDTAALAAYLDAGLRPADELGEEGSTTALDLACALGVPSVVEFLLERGADASRVTTGMVEVRKPDTDGRVRTSRERLAVGSPLHAAVAKECEECVAILLRAGAEADIADWRGVTPLARAVQGWNPGIVQRLLEAEAPLEAVVSSADQREGPLVEGATPLWIAAYNGRQEMVRALLEAGADPEVEAFCGGHRRARPGEERCSVRRIAELNERQAVVDLLDGTKSPDKPGTSQRVTAEEVLGRDMKPERRHSEIAAIFKRGDLEGLRALLDAGLDPDQRVFEGEYVPLLSLAVAFRKNPLVDLLLERGADVDRMSLGSPDAVAANSGFLAPSGAPPEEPPPQSAPFFSPLMYAVRSGNTEAFDRLLGKKADVNAESFRGLTALGLAAAAGRTEMVARLLAAGARLEERIENPERLPRLEAHRATALWLAAYSGSAGAVRILLQAGADPAAEAECRSRLARSDEDMCAARRIAELRQHAPVVRAIDEHLSRTGAGR